MSNLNQNLYTFGHRAGLAARVFFSAKQHDNVGIADVTLATSCQNDTSALHSSTSGFLYEMTNRLLSFPRTYKEWWIKLVQEDPAHVLIETVLILFVIYMMIFKKRRDWRMEMKEKLSAEEEEDLIREWKPEPLAPSTEEERGVYRSGLILQKSRGSKIWVKSQTGDSPHDSDPAATPLLNMMTHDFLGMSTRPSLKDASARTLRAYGCGACGPRGFYGSVDVHLEFEAQIAAFCGAEGAILYSDGASASSSTVAAFAKRGDLLVVDEGVYEPLMTGVTLSRANVKFFKHNDMKDLHRVLDQIHKNDLKIGRKSCDQRRFIITEALFKNYGHITPLDELISLKSQYSYRLILDESFSFGTLGPTGRGALELYSKSIMKDVEIVCFSVENALGGIGGVCVGNLTVVDHQRLSGAGYCFSAALPPFLASAAIEALTVMTEQPDLLGCLNRNRKMLYEGCQDTVPKLVITSDERSPIIFLRLRDGDAYLTREEEFDVLVNIVEKCREGGVAMVSTSHVKYHLQVVPPPSIRMTITAAHSKEDVELALGVLKEAVDSVLSV